MPSSSNPHEQWGTRGREKDRSHDQARTRESKPGSGGAGGRVSVKRYEALFSRKVRLPEMRVDAQVWDRIVDALPRGYVIPDRMLIDWLHHLVALRKKAKKTVDS